MVSALADMLHTLRQGRALGAKQDIATAMNILRPDVRGPVRMGDDCVAIPDGDGYRLLASEGFQDSFVRAMPWFPGYRRVLVNSSDLSATWWRPLARVDSLRRA